MSQGIIQCDGCGICDVCRVRADESAEVVLAKFGKTRIVLRRYPMGTYLEAWDSDRRYSESLDNVVAAAARMGWRPT